jgi:ribosomal protein S6--L-glutamate ligase
LAVMLAKPSHSVTASLIQDNPMKTLIVVNGEQYWQQHFPGYQVHATRLQASKWLYYEEKLWVIDGAGTTQVDAVLWRVGAIRPHPNHRAVLELIRMAGVPCVNSAQTLLRGFDRLSMLNEMHDAGLPVILFSALVGDQLLDKVQPELPAVIKIGNYHAGYGKVKAVDLAQWNDIRDLSFISEDYITIEPYIDYTDDIRCLAVGDDLWAMSRRGRGWKANTDTTQYELIDVPPILGDYTMRAMAHLNADILGLDFLQTQEGEYVLLESNDIPGLSGFPDAVPQALARCMIQRMG